MTDRRPRRQPAAACSCDPQLLGEIKGTQNMILKQLETQGETLKGLDARLRTQETRGAIAGSIAGMVMAIAVQLTAWTLRGGRS